MKEKYTIKTREVKRLLFYASCPLCKKEITGHDKVTLINNMGRHMIKCRKVKEK